MGSGPGPLAGEQDKVARRDGTRRGPPLQGKTSRLRGGTTSKMGPGWPGSRDRARAATTRPASGGRRALSPAEALVWAVAALVGGAFALLMLQLNLLLGLLALGGFALLFWWERRHR